MRHKERFTNGVEEGVEKNDKNTPFINKIK
jgi:hypothetical protein